MKFISLFFSITLSLLALDIKPLPQAVPVDTKKATLGKALFFDPILSYDGTIACANCHNLYEGGDDNMRVSIGIGGKKGSINSPTVFNAVFNFRQFWDGRAKDLQEQAAGPILNPVEMGNTFDNLIKTLKKSRYAQSFKKLYPKKGICKESITDAIAEYEKTLITPNAPFDRYLKGDKKAISPSAIRGYELFKTKGCIACHNGVGVGGNSFNKIGVMSDYNSSELGRYNVTKRERDRYVFKVPSLRNVSKTAPYMHDGKYSSLKEVVKVMLYYQLGRVAQSDEVDDIVSFLESLNGEVSKKVLP